MAQYIDKSALVAEIESKRKYAQVLGDNAINSSMQQFYDGMMQGCVDLLSFLDTIDMKEVDLDYIKDELDRVVKTYKPDGDFGWGTLYNIATHFFELGLKAQKGEEYDK